ncbi:MAG TPA: ubiquinol-cytochrome c reductase iron-sulfur subunit [Longimicrobiales bacterium]|nr:ubiquinol-cytochrome c reductase iron-sulfur subunit [Longimicrobiales bacterium]
MGNETVGKAVSRRELLINAARAALGVTVVGVAVPLLDGCNAGNLTGNRPTKKTFDVSQLTQDGQALVTKDYGPDGAPVLIVRQAADSYYALSMLCTHAACFVGAPSQGVMVCPCHGSEFNMKGQVLRGPAFNPLHQYSLTYDATAQTVTLG